MNHFLIKIYNFKAILLIEQLIKPKETIFYVTVWMKYYFKTCGCYENSNRTSFLFICWYVKKNDVNYSDRLKLRSSRIVLLLNFVSENYKSELELRKQL